MITIKSILILFIMLGIVPFILGLLWTGIMKDEYEKNSIALSYILGTMTVFILYQIPAVPMIIMRQSFSTLTNIWVIEITILCLASFILNFRRFKIIASKKKDEIAGWVKTDLFSKLLTLSFVALVMIQAFLLSYASIYDTDDARYTAESLDAMNTDKMLLTHPLTGEILSAPLGEMVKDVVSPFSMMQASVSKIANIHPATLCHVVLPLFLIPLCYLVYWLLAGKVFGAENREKRLFFMNFMCVLFIFGRMSAFWDSAYLLWRIWQGKAILAAIIIPLLFWIMYGIIKDVNCREYDVLLCLTMWASCILTPMGMVIPVVISGIYGLLICFYNKKIRVLFRLCICYIPTIIYLIVSMLIGMERYAI